MLCVASAPARGARRQSRRCQGLAPEYGLLEHKSRKRRVVTVQPEPNPYAVHYVQETGEEVPMCTKARTLDEIPAYCAWLAYQLIQQPIFTGGGAIHRPVIFLPGIPWDSCRIIEICSRNTRSLLGAYYWDINAVGCGYNWRFSADRKIYYGEGIELWLDQENYLAQINNLKSHLFEFYVGFHTMIAELKTGWVQADPKAYPDLFHTKDEKEYLFFLKPEQRLAQEEDTLVRFLVSYFNQGANVSCYDYWRLTPEYTSHVRHQLYLWIKKDAFAEFQRIFNFEFTLLRAEEETIASA